MDFNELIRSDITESFLLGSSFKDIYSFYKKAPVETAMTEQEKKEFEVCSYFFQILDVSLYLDTHTSEEGTKYINTMKNKFLKALTEYESEYGALSHLTFLDTIYNYPYSTWTWEK